MEPFKWDSDEDVPLLCVHIPGESNDPAPPVIGAVRLLVENAVGNVNLVRDTAARLLVLRVEGKPAAGADLSQIEPADPLTMARYSRGIDAYAHRVIINNLDMPPRTPYIAINPHIAVPVTAGACMAAVHNEWGKDTIQKLANEAALEWVAWMNAYVDGLPMMIGQLDGAVSDPGICRRDIVASYCGILRGHVWTRGNDIVFPSRRDAMPSDRTPKAAAEEALKGTQLIQALDDPVRCVRLCDAGRYVCDAMYQGAGIPLRPLPRNSDQTSPCHAHHPGPSLHALDVLYYSQMRLWYAAVRLWREHKTAPDDTHAYALRVLRYLLAVAVCRDDGIHAAHLLSESPVLGMRDPVEEMAIALEKHKATHTRWDPPDALYQDEDILDSGAGVGPAPKVEMAHDIRTLSLPQSARDNARAATQITFTVTPRESTCRSSDHLLPYLRWKFKFFF